MSDFVVGKIEQLTTRPAVGAFELKTLLERATLEEREACAKTVEDEAVNAEETGTEEDRVYNLALKHAADSIRLRSNAKLPTGPSG